MLILSKMRFYKCKFGEKWDFQNVDFLDKLWFFAPVCQSFSIFSARKIMSGGILSIWLDVPNFISQFVQQMPTVMTPG